MAQHPILNLIKPANEFSVGPLSMLLYSEPGQGKTTWASESVNPLIVDVDSGSLSLTLKKTPVIRKYSYENLVELMAALKDDKEQQYKTIVIDTVSELQKRWTDDIVKRAHARNPNRHQFIPVQADYNETTIMVRRLVIDLLSLDRHVILISHSVEKQEEADGPTFIRPNITPALTSGLLGLVDVVCFMKMNSKGDKRTFYFSPTHTIMAKHRLETFLPDKADNITFKDILRAKRDFVKSTQTEETTTS